jgi:LmbE family N-acetylglucosaminyl deacetylase
MVMSKYFLAVVMLLVTQISIKAQMPSNEIYLNLKKLNVLGSVLYIAAHPDDENNALLPYFAKEKMYRTAYLSLTRGDGGQNLIGSEQGIELGLIRTQELLAARRIDGSEQYFSTAYEFGFSKSSTEALSIWNHEKVLANAVWVIRNYQPDVIIARFPPDKRAGHGHHAASAIIAQEAFMASADATKFPEQLKYVKPWKAKRLVWNTFNFGGNNTTNDAQLKIDIGAYNALLGQSYGEIGAVARTMHKSQGEGRPKRKGSITEYFSHVAGDSATKDLLEGITTSWSRVEGGDAIKQQIEKIIANFNFEKPELSIPALVQVYKALQGLDRKTAWSIFKMKEVQQLIVACSGFYMEAVTDNEYAVKGEKLQVSFLVNNRLGSGIKLDNVMLNTASVNAYDTLINSYLLPNKNLSFSKSFIVPNEMEVTQPYWLSDAMENGSMFNVTDLQKIGSAESMPSFMAKFIFSIDNISFTQNVPVQYKYVDPVRGEVLQPVVIIPAMIVSMNPDVVLTNVLPKTATTKNPMVQVQYKANVTLANASITVVLKQGSKEVYTKDTSINLEVGKSYSLELPLKNLLDTKLSDNNLNVAVGIKGTDKTKYFSHYLRKISYDHIPNLHYFYKDNVKVIADTVKTKVGKVGYIVGAGDKVSEAITQLGYDVKYLFEKDITNENLKQFDAIIVGIRAYNIYEWLSSKNDILNTYVSNGGNLVVQYLKSNTVGLSKVKVGPYPFVVNAGTRVTEENAAVKFLLPNHAVLNYPNKVTDKDFEGWTQERSTYQAEQLDSHYETPLAMNDAGEKESNGSLAIAKYGKGNFAYVSLVLFRQLPAGVPGAYKLLANLIALPKNK